MPKQKLSIIDNLQQFHSSSKHVEFGQLKSNKQSIPNSYALNDLINFTCSSGFSKPAAKLGWFINDTPVINSSQLQTHLSMEMHNSKKGLIESKLSLAFRIGLEHMFNKNVYDPKRDGLQRQSYSRFLYENNLRPLKLRCSSRLIVEFTSETEIFVLNGSKSSPKRSRNLIESVNNNDNKTNTIITNKSANGLAKNDSIGVSKGNFEEYKWPRAFGSKKTIKPPINSKLHSWTQNSDRNNDQEQMNELPNDKISVSNNQVGSNLVVWTNQQLKSQADSIEKILSIAHSNEFESPKIKANTHNLSDFLLDTTAGIPKRADSKASNRQFKENINSAYGNNELLVQSGDYQPNDIVKFTCIPSYKLPEEVEVVKKVYSKWLLNNKEVSLWYSLS